MAAFADRSSLEQHQTDRLRSLLQVTLSSNSFYREKLGQSLQPSSLPTSPWREWISQLPFTEKPELAEDQRRHPPYGSNLAHPLSHYTRCHQTSGSSGAPLRWLDTTESWNWMLGNWDTILDAVGVKVGDRVFFAFSFGPFLGFWTAFEASIRRGCLVFPGGGLNTVVRLRQILEHQTSTLFCTPTYAIHLGEVAQKEKIDLSQSAVEHIIVAGEPGGSLPSTRDRIQSLWPKAQVFDHHGMTEIGPVSYQCPTQPGRLHVIESSFIAEVLDPQTLKPVAPGNGNKGELVLTNLGRIGSPLIRYRTGDWVCPEPSQRCACGTWDLGLAGGILGRTDDMIVVRGVNLYPSGVDEVIRRLGDIAEYQVEVHDCGSLSEVRLRVEARSEELEADRLRRRLEQEFQHAFSLRCSVEVVPSGTLPRYEFKSRRWFKVGEGGRTELPRPPGS